MSILDRHPAPWTKYHSGHKCQILDFGGSYIRNSGDGHMNNVDPEEAKLIMELHSELAAARAENERLREALQDMLHFFRGNYCDPSKVIEQAEAALRKAGVE